MCRGRASCWPDEKRGCVPGPLRMSRWRSRPVLSSPSSPPRRPSRAILRHDVEPVRRAGPPIHRDLRAGHQAAASPTATARATARPAAARHGGKRLRRSARVEHRRDRGTPLRRGLLGRGVLPHPLPDPRGDDLARRPARARLPDQPGVPDGPAADLARLHGGEGGQERLNASRIVLMEDSSCRSLNGYAGLWRMARWSISGELPHH